MPRTQNSPFALLKQDHKEVRSLLETMIADSEDEKVSKSNIQKLHTALTLHTQIEEEFLYPRAEEEAKAAPLIEESYKEHKETKTLLKEIQPDKEPSEINKYCQQLLIGLEHHIQEEEEELFPLLERSWDEKTLNEVKTQMQKAHERGLAKS